MYRLLVLVLVLLLIVGCQVRKDTNSDEEVKPREDLFTIGDYVLFGSYEGYDLVFRVISVDEEGNPLFYSHMVIDFMAFDLVGSNRWSQSSLREWLNDEETGFISSQNFDIQERSAILSTRHKSLLSESDNAHRDGGEGGHQWSHMIDRSIGNYDNAYFEWVEDRVFILSVKEFKDFLYDRGFEYRSEPTAIALNKNESKDIKIDNERYVSKWLRTPYYTHESLVRTLALGGYVVHDTGMILSAFADSDNIGVSPAFYVDVTKITILEGTGKLDSPFAVKVR